MRTRIRTEPPTHHCMFSNPQVFWVGGVLILCAMRVMLSLCGSSSERRSRLDLSTKCESITQVRRTPWPEIFVFVWKGPGLVHGLGA